MNQKERNALINLAININTALTKFAAMLTEVEDDQPAERDLSDVPPPVTPLAVAEPAKKAKRVTKTFSNGEEVKAAEPEVAMPAPSNQVMDAVAEDDRREAKRGEALAKESDDRREAKRAEALAKEGAEKERLTKEFGEDVKNKLTKLIKERDKQTVIDVLSRFGSKKLSDLNPIHYEEFLKLADEELAPKETAPTDAEDFFGDM